MQKPDRRPVYRTGLSLIGAGAVLGIALAAPASAAPPDSPRPDRAGSAQMTEQDRPDR